MKAKTPLIMLRDLAQQAVEQAAQQLGQLRQAQQATQQQLAMLLSYQDEYQQQLNITLCSGIGAARWQNYQQFIGTLEQAITQHRQQLFQSSHNVDRAVQQWRDKQQRLNAFTTLHTRALHTEQVLINKYEQKMTDEFAQRGGQRSLSQ